MTMTMMAVSSPQKSTPEPDLLPRMSVDIVGIFWKFVSPGIRQFVAADRVNQKVNISYGKA
jgi:hypothetical protein